MLRIGFAVGLLAMLLVLPSVRGDEEPKPEDPKKPRPDQETTLVGQKGFEVAYGSAFYRDRPDDRQLTIVAKKVMLSRGTPLTVEINGIKVGTIQVGYFRSGSLKLRWKRDEEDSDKDNIPFVTIGTPVVVRTDKAIVLSGRF